MSEKATDSGIHEVQNTSRVQDRTMTLFQTNSDKGNREFAENLFS